MLIFPLKKQLRSAQNALNLSAALTGSTGARRCLMSHECHESEYSKFLKSLGIDKEKMLADMESRLPEDKRNRLRKMRLERIEELEKENAELIQENEEMKAEIRKMKSQHFTDIRLYTKVIGIAVEESVMNDKQNYKNYLFDKAKKILSMGVDK